MRILLTGANGFIGSWLKPELVGHEVIPVDRGEGDLAKPEVFSRLLDQAAPDVVIHLAAKYGRLKGEVDPAFTVDQNATVTTRVSHACGQAGVRLVYVSSSEVYGDHGSHVITEDDTYRHLPHNVYGLSKRWGEEVARLYAPKNLLILRLNMPYGPRQEGGWGACALINILQNAIAHKPIVIHRGAERSWCWVGDTVRAVRLALERSDGGVFNISRDDDPRSMVDVARLACLLTDAPLSLVEVVDPPGMQTVVKRLSSSKIRALGWEPRVSLEDGMREWLSTR